MPATLIWTLQSIAGGCQSSEMAALLKALYFAFTKLVSAKVPCQIIWLYCKVVQWGIMYLVCIDEYWLHFSFKLFIYFFTYSFFQNSWVRTRCGRISWTAGVTIGVGTTGAHCPPLFSTVTWLEIVRSRSPSLVPTLLLNGYIHRPYIHTFIHCKPRGFYDTSVLQEIT